MLMYIVLRNLDVITKAWGGFEEILESDLTSFISQYGSRVEEVFRGLEMEARS